MTHEPWTDERLAAAFVDRYDRPAPRDLAVTTLEHIRETRRRPRWWPGLDRPTASRLGVAVAVIAVVSLVGVFALPRTSSKPVGTAAASAEPSAIPSTALNTPYESVEPSPAVAGFAAVAAELPVRSVGDVPLLLADPGLSDTELAFGGWYSASDLALPCPYQGEPASPIEIRCVDVRAGLAATEQPIFTDDGSPVLGRRDPAYVIRLRFVPPVDPIRGTSGPRDAMATTPRPIVLIGHFHDERAARCPSDGRLTCEQTFVVDGVASTAGELSDPSTASQPATSSTRLTPAAVTKIARDRVAGYGQILSVGLEQGNDAPWFANSGNLDCLCPPTWFVRGYRVLMDDGSDPRAPGTPVAGWLTIDDATGAMAGPLATAIPAPETPFPFAPAPAGFPTTIESLPVRTVADLVDPDRLPDPPETPIAVAGWFSQLPPHPCPSGAADCNRETVVLAGSDKRLVTYGPGDSRVVVPSDAPVLNPAILPGGGSPPPVLGDGAPRRAVFIVHSGDPRADRRGSGDPVGARTFVLDQVAWLDGKAHGPAVWIEPGLTPLHTAEEVLRDTDGGAFSAPGTWPISISAVNRDDLASVGIAESGPSVPDAIAWVVRLVGRRPGDGGVGNGFGWTLVDDATGTTFESLWTSP